MPDADDYWANKFPSSTTSKPAFSADDYWANKFEPSPEEYAERAERAGLTTGRSLTEHQQILKERGFSAADIKTLSTRYRQGLADKQVAESVPAPLFGEGADWSLSNLGRTAGATLAQLNPLSKEGAVRMIPGASWIINNTKDVQESADRIEKGTATDKDFLKVAKAKQQHEFEQNVVNELGPLGHAIVGLRSAPAIVGEALLGGAALTSLGAKVPGLAGRVMTGAAGASTGRAPLLSAMNPTILQKFGTHAGRMSLLTAAMPSMYADVARQKNIENGRPSDAIEGYGPGFLYGYAQMLVLGKVFGAGPGKSGYLAGAKEFAGKATGLALEKGIADSATALIDQVLPKAYKISTGEGTFEKLLKGDLGDAAQQFAADALSLGAFAAMHRAGGGKERLDTEIMRKVAEAQAKDYKTLRDNGVPEADAYNLVGQARATVFEAVRDGKPVPDILLFRDQKAATAEAMRKAAEAAAAEAKPAETPGARPETPGKVSLKDLGEQMRAPKDEYHRWDDAFLVDLARALGMSKKIKSREATIEWLKDRKPMPITPKVLEDFEKQLIPPERPGAAPAEPPVQPTETPPGPEIVPPAPSGEAKAAQKVSETPTAEPPTSGPESPHLLAKAGEAPPSSSESPRGPDLMMASKIDAALAKNTTLTPEQKAEQRKGATDALESLPAAARARIDQNVKDVEFYASPVAAYEATLTAMIGRAKASGDVGTAAMLEKDLNLLKKGELLAVAAVDELGVLRIDGAIEVGGKGPFATEGKSSVRELALHEYGHLIDGPDHALSKSPGWRKSYGKEMSMLAVARNNYDIPLTEYAAKSPSEGFAELIRVVNDGRYSLQAIEARVPECVKFLRENGLLPAESKGTETKPSEVFNKRIGPPGDAAHIDAKVAEAPRGLKVVTDSAKPGQYNLMVDGVRKGHITVGEPAESETAAARKLFPDRMKPGETAARMSDVQVSMAEQGKGYGQWLYLKALAETKADWLYNTQAEPGAADVKETLARKGWIEFHFRGLAGPRGTSIFRITPEGRKALANRSFLESTPNRQLQAIAAKQGSTAGKFPSSYEKPNQRPGLMAKPVSPEREVMRAYEAATGRAKIFLETALDRAGYLEYDAATDSSKPAKPKDKKQATRDLQEGLASSWRDAPPEVLEVLEPLMHKLGMAKLGEAGEPAKFDGSIHAHLPGLFTDHPVVVRKAGWGIPEGKDRTTVLVKAIVEPPGPRGPDLMAGRPLTDAEKRAGVSGGGEPTAGERVPESPRETALANAITAVERAANRLPPLEDGQPISDAAAWDAALRRLAADPTAEVRLIDQLEANPRATTVEENALLLHRRVDLANQHERAIREANAAMMQRLPPQEFDALAARETMLLREIDRLDRVIDRVGTETGRSLRFRRRLVREDFSLSNMLVRATFAAGRELTPQERQEVTTLHEAIRDADTNLAVAEAAALAEATAAAGGTGTGTGGTGNAVIGESAAAKLADLRIETRTTRRAFAERLDGFQYAKMTPRQKVFHKTREVFNAARSIVTSMDFSAVFRQGGFSFFSHPILAMKAVPEMLRAARTEQGFERAWDSLLQRENALLYETSGLYLANRSGPLTAQEEAFMGKWTRKIPGVAASERAYTAFLNRIRADIFDAHVATLKRNAEPTTEEIRAIANFVNVSTGRGGLGAAEKAAVPLAALFFSPRYVASRFQLLAGQPMYGGTSRTRKLIAQEYARVLAGLGLFYAVASMDDDAKISFDPRSSDFGKIRYDNTRVDPLSGLAQTGVFVTRIVSGEKRDSKGKLIPLRDDYRFEAKGKVPYRGDDVSDVIKNFIRTKLAPVPSSITNILAGKNIVGQPTTVASTAGGLVVPLSVKDVYKALEEQGLPRGAAISLLAILGMGASTYEAGPRRNETTLEEFLR